MEDRRPKVCLTAGGVLIHQGKVLLIKHKKLNMWLNPGGHVDEGELPHQAAEREFLEETGVKVRVTDPFIELPSHESTSQFKSRYFPSPILTNLHWVCEQNYQARVFGKSKPDPDWPKGCEQHLGFTYLVELVDSEKEPQLSFNREETTQISWFSQKELVNLDSLSSEIRWEIELAFRLSRNRL